MVVSELRGEKIDIIPFNEEPARFVAKALSPARVREVLVDDEGRQATVIVPDDQLSLAIGKEGLNARLAARLTGWRVDIRSETEFAEDEAEMGYEEEDAATGRCAAILSNGRRCPNAALPGSRYCGLPAHQALVDQEGDQVEPSADTPAAGAPAAEQPLEEAPVEGGGVAGGDGAAEEAPVEEAPVGEGPVEEPETVEPVQSASPESVDPDGAGAGEDAVTREPARPEGAS